eukprot:jgi/Mesen1/9647/ME000671S09012
MQPLVWMESNPAKQQVHDFDLNDEAMEVDSDGDQTMGVAPVAAAENESVSSSKTTANNMPLLARWQEQMNGSGLGMHAHLQAQGRGGALMPAGGPEGPVSDGGSRVGGPQESHLHPSGDPRQHQHEHEHEHDITPLPAGDNLSQQLFTSRLLALDGYEERWRLDLAKLTVGREFESGAFGRLYRGRYRNEEVAIKILRQVDPGQREELEKNFHMEVRFLAGLRHDNVVAFRGAGVHAPLGLWCIVTEYCPGGSLRSFLAQRRDHPLSSRTAVSMALDIARGMQYLHALAIIHRDLKSDNLLIARGNRIRIADFGVARIATPLEGMTPETGTYRWMAPEVVRGGEYSNKVDVYSFGIVMWELFTRQIPFASMSPVQAAHAVTKKIRPVIPEAVPSELCHIMSACWHHEPGQRPTFQEVVALLEDAEQSIRSSVVGRARFRCCCLAPSNVSA